MLRFALALVLARSALAAAPACALERGGSLLLGGGVLNNVTFFPSGRNFLLATPPAHAMAPPQGFPLLFVIHGYTDGNAHFLEHTQFATRATQRGYVVVAPFGDAAVRGGAWSLGNAPGDGTYDHDKSTLADELSFLTAVPDCTAALLPPSMPLSGAIFLAGLSQGGKISCRLACAQMPPRWRVNAMVLAAGIQGEPERACSGAPVALLLLYGGLDPVVPLCSTGGFGYRPGASDLLTWARVYNKCNSAAHRPTAWCPSGAPWWGTVEGGSAEQRLSTSAYEFVGCAAPTVLLWTPTDSHVWPMPLLGVGGNATERALDFFQNQRVPPALDTPCELSPPCDMLGNSL